MALSECRGSKDRSALHEFFFSPTDLEKVDFNKAQVNMKDTCTE